MERTVAEQQSVSPDLPDESFCEGYQGQFLLIALPNAL